MPSNSTPIEDARQRALRARRDRMTCPHQGTGTLCMCEFDWQVASLDWARLSRQKVRH